MYEVVPRPSLIQSRSVTQCCPVVAFSGGICDIGFILSEKKVFLLIFSSDPKIGVHMLNSGVKQLFVKVSAEP